MNRMKKALAVLLTAVLMFSSMTVSAATSSPAKKSVADATAVAAKATYDGSVKAAKMTVTLDGKTLVEGVDFIIANNTKVNAGVYLLKIRGIGQYTGTQNVRYTIQKANQKISGSGITTSYKASKLAKKSVTTTLKSKGKSTGKVTYKITTCPKAMKGKISVSSTGKITLKKGIKKGTYRVTVTCKGDANYKEAKRVITIKVK